jgi:hypothetical protein
MSSQETITVYRDTYEKLQTREFTLRTELSTLRGQIIGLSKVAETSPEYALEAFLKIAQEISKKEVDTVA